MLINIIFSTPENDLERELTDCMIYELIQYTDDVIRRKPEYTIQGRKRVSLKFHNLSKHEAELLYPAFREEIRGEIIDNVYLFRNPKNEKDPGPFEFTQPEYKEESREKMERRLEEGEHRGMDIRKVVESIVEITVKVQRDRYIEELEKKGAPPISSKALSRYFFVLDCVYEGLDALESGDLGEDDDLLETLYIYDLVTERVTVEKMYKERTPRRPRRPRKPRDRTILKELREEEKNSSSGASGNAGP